MAISVLTDVTINIAGIDYTDHITQATITETAADKDATNFGSAGWMARRGGLKDFKATFNVQQDFAASEFDTSITTVGVGGSVGFTGKPTSAATSATNPQFSGSLLVTELPHVSGQVGDLHAFSVTWPSSGGSLHRATS
jgi:hypothetical protein